MWRGPTVFLYKATVFLYKAYFPTTSPEKNIILNI